MATELGYLTIPVSDVPRAMVFFEALFGWRFEAGAGAHVINTRLPMGLSTGGPTDYSKLYFEVSDINAMIAKVVTMGGDASAVTESRSGLSSVCKDDQGTLFSLWQPAPGFESSAGARA